MITVLVTGSNGQLGKCLKDISINTTNIKWIFKSSESLDITDENSIHEVFENNKINYLVNCAAYTAVDRAESEKEKAYLVNAEGVRFIANACKEHNAILIHISTDFVFDGNNSTPYLETDKPNPINVYGASKFKGELYIQKILTNYFIIRTSWVYSEYGNNFVKTMLCLAEERDEINVVNDQVGSPTYAGDLAKVILHVILNIKFQYGTYHYSNRGEITWYDFACAIFNFSNKTIQVKPINSEEYKLLARRPKFSVLNTSKIINSLEVKIFNWNFILEKVIEKITKLKT